VLGALAAETADLPGAREAVDFIQRAFSAHDAEALARAGVGRLALLAAAAALQGCAPPEVAELFARTRLSARHDAMYGSTDLGAGEARLLERALP
jgi:putative acyl-CoA dehydrogenase